MSAVPYQIVTSHRSALEDFKKMFSRFFDLELTPIQMIWARRYLLGESIHIIAPYRSGKTTFGLAAAIFASIRSGRCSLFITDKEELPRLSGILYKLVKGGLISPEDSARVQLIDPSKVNEQEVDGEPGLIIMDESFLLRPKLRGVLKKYVGLQTSIIAMDSYVPAGASSLFGRSRLTRIKAYGSLRQVRDFYVIPRGELSQALVEVLEVLGHGGILASSKANEIQKELAGVLNSKGLCLQRLEGGGDSVTLYLIGNGGNSISPPGLSQHPIRYVVFVGIPLTRSDVKTAKVPDVRRYLKLSSLASGFSYGNASIGLSVLLVDDDSALKSLEELLRSECGINITRWDEDLVLKHLKEDSQGVDKKYNAYSGFFQQILVLVESPTKARTISSFFNGAYSRRTESVYRNMSFGDDFLLEVIATGGHITDLSLSEGFHGVFTNGVKSYLPVYSFIRRCKKCGSQFNSLPKCPSCGSSDFVDKSEVVDVIRQAALVSDRILIATDPDAEGEKIAWDLCVMLKPFNPNVARAEFHEVTRHAFEEAIRSPREISLNLVDAQISRRVEDRWIGFELSRRLWKKFSKKTLSAGRAQSPILNWIVNRTKENKEKLTYAFITLDNGIQFRVSEKDVEDIQSFAKDAKGARAVVEELGESEVEIIPPPPYTTDSMLRDASFQLRLPSWLVMRAAQRLFESGLITYHRTDSTRVSPYGLAVARNYIENSFGPGYYRGRIGGEAGAHEAIRVTRPLDTTGLLDALRTGKLNVQVKLNREEIRLYDLIFKRFVASQMTSARVRVQRIKVKLMGFEATQKRRVEVVEEGFMKLLNGRVEKRVAGGEYVVTQVRTRKLPKAWLFTEGELISQMRSRGIGRPSTYSKLVETILKRRYAFEVNGRLISTELGEVVNEYLQSNYSQYVSEETTRELERKMRQIEEGGLGLQTFLSELYEEIKRLP